MRVAFDIQQLYYWPQFLPVYKELLNRGAECHLVFYREHIQADVLAHVRSTENLKHCSSALSESDVAGFYDEYAPDWLVCGNTYMRAEELPTRTRTALLYHGIGVKQSYYHSQLVNFDVRFVEGEFRENELRRQHPSAVLHTVGFAKLDPLFNPNEPVAKPDDFGLANGKPTLLYAPTFYPSSIERIADDWPRQMSDWNFLIKPHFFSLTKSAYKKQRRKLLSWSEFDNVHLADTQHYSLLPYMQCADILVSEASSALFEFAALDKPVVWCDFLQLRWNYRGVFSYRMKKRMDPTITPYEDIAVHAAKPKDLVSIIRSEHANPSRLKARRAECTLELLGQTDGRASVRAVDYLYANAISS